MKTSSLSARKTSRHCMLYNLLCSCCALSGCALQGGSSTPARGTAARHRRRRSEPGSGSSSSRKVPPCPPRTQPRRSHSRRVSSTCRSYVPVGHRPSNLRIVVASRTVRRATRLSSPPGLPSVTWFSAPPRNSRERLLVDALALMVLTVLIDCSVCRFLLSQPPVP